MKNQSGNEKCMKSFLQTKIAMLLLGLAMCLSLALGITLASPTATASAETALAPYSIIYIEGIEGGQLNNGWYLGTDGYHTYRGDPSTGYVAKYKDGILTLNGYDGGAIGTNASAAGFYTVELIGENVITTTGQNGLYLTISNGARLTVTSDTGGSLAINVTNESSVLGIDAAGEQYKNNVIIAGNAKVSIDITSSGANEEADGIIANELTVEGEANLDITAKNTNSATSGNSWVKGIFAYSAVRLDTAGTINIDVREAGGGTAAYSNGIQTMSGPSAFQLNKVGNMTIRWKRERANGNPFSPKNPEFLQDHAINVDETNCFASYRFGKPYEVSVYNGTLTGPGVPNANDTANFLAGDEVTLSSPDYTVSDTDTTVIPFAKWTADEGTITNQTTQNGAKYTLPSSPTKDVLQVKATHGAFTKTPEFERTAEGSGVVTADILSNGYKGMRLGTVESPDSPVGGFFTLKSGSTYQLIATDSYVPAGEYVVVVDYNNVKFYSEPFIVDYTERKADVGDVTVFGEKDLKITDTDVLVTLTGYTFTSYINGNWITNLPSGLSQKLTRISDTEVKITVSGTPAEEVNEEISVTIPKNNLVKAGKDITAVSNANAKFEIVAPLIAIPVPTPKPNVVYNGGVLWGFEAPSGTGYYLSEGYSAINAGTYTAIAKLDSGYKWEDGTVEDKEIEWTIEQAEIDASFFEFAPPSGSLVYDGAKKEASVTVRSYYESEGFTVTVKYQKDGAFVSDPTDAGTYTVYIDTSETANYKAGKDVTDSSWTFTIERAEQAAPEAATFTATAPTAEGESDGKITGVTEAMEYKEASSSAWTAVTGTEITGLAAGNYEIRFKQTDNYNASPSVSITIPDGGAATYTLTVENGTGSGIIAEGDSVTITADEITGAEFVSWEITGLDTSGLDLTNAELTFTMPASDVTATALYSYIDYKVTVVGGTAYTDGDPAESITAKYGDFVNIVAEVPTGKRFVRWTSDDGVVFANATSAETTFTMPAKPVVVTAVFEDIDYTVTVTDGTADKSTAHYGDTVKITADTAPVGQTFDRWEITGIDTASLDLTQAELTFTVGTADIAAKATYKYIDYTVTVVGGTAYTDGDPAESITAKYGDFINIVADVPTGKRFVKWTSDIGTVAFDHDRQETTTFEMPANSVTITAVFEDIDYTVTVTDGTADKTTAHYGDTVSITAGEAPEGKVFDKWTCETDGITIEVVKPKFAFQAIVGEGKGSILYGGEEMPNGYYGDHKAGEQIALKAVADSGYEFVGWYTDANEPQLISADAEHTFTTGNAPQTVKAVFNAVVTSLRLDAANAGFTDGEATYVIGSENRPDPENVLVYGVTVESKKCLDRELYTIDLGGLDFTKKDSYTITYTYTKNTSIKATLTIMVVDEGEINLTMHGSPTSYYYTGGNSIIITKSQIRNNGEECDLEALGLNWEWRDKDGNVVTLLSDHTWELDWFDSPTTAGEYKFVIYSEKDGVKTDLLTVDTVISERKVSMVTDASELRHHEHYTPIAKVTKDGTTRYYAMPIPGSFSSNMSKLPAIEVFPDADGNFMIGSKTEFSFFIYAVPKYHDVYNISIGGRTLVEEGSLYLGKSGVIAFDSTYSAGDFGVTFSFNADNSVNIKCPHEGGKLSFAYTEADGYYFTAKADDSAATYYPVYLYDKYVEPPKEHYEYIGGDLSKTYDGAPVSIDPYKDFVIRTENGEDWSWLSKYGTGRFAWGTGKGENLQPMTENEYGILEGPSEVGDYCIVFQIKLKDGTWQTVSEPLVYFAITAA